MLLWESAISYLMTWAWPKLKSDATKRKKAFSGVIRKPVQCWIVLGLILVYRTLRCGYSLRCAVHSKQFFSSPSPKFLMNANFDYSKLNLEYSRILDTSQAQMETISDSVALGRSLWEKNQLCKKFAKACKFCSEKNNSYFLFQDMYKGGNLT